MCVLRDSETVCVFFSSTRLVSKQQIQISWPRVIFLVHTLLCHGHVIYFDQMPPGGAVTYTSWTTADSLTRGTETVSSSSDLRQFVLSLHQ